MIKVDGRQAAGEIPRSGLVPLNDSEVERVAGGRHNEDRHVVPTPIPARDNLPETAIAGRINAEAESENIQFAIPVDEGPAG